MTFTIKLERFEGPYTALLDLIESRKLSITEISLVSVTDDYIAHIQTLENKDAIDISQFIVVASTLMLMKAKSLLPEMVYTEEEEKQIGDLESKLALHALLREGEKKIKDEYMKSPLYMRAHSLPDSVDVFVPDSKTNLPFLHSVASMTLMTFLEPKVITKVAVEQALRIEHVIENIMERIKSVKSFSLTSVAQGSGTGEEKKRILIMSFIAILELLRHGSLQATQEGGDIILSQNTQQVP